MTEADWYEIVADLNGVFAGGFPPDRAAAFYRRFGAMRSHEFTAVMERLVRSSTYAPSIAEFSAAIAGPSTPWPEVWRIAEQAAHHCGRGNANQAAIAWAAAQGIDTAGMVPRTIDDQEGNTDAAALAAQVVRRHAGPAAADWFAASGRRAILAPSARFGDEFYGEKAIRELGDTYTPYTQQVVPVRRELER